MSKIKGLDGRPIRTTPTLEDIQAHGRGKLKQAHAIREREIKKGTSQEIIKKIVDAGITEILARLDKDEEVYKENVKNYISQQSDNLQTKIYLVYERYKESKWVVGFILGIFFEEILKMIQEVEVMKGTPKDFEICSNIGYEIHHAPVMEELRKTNRKIRLILLDGSELLANHIHKKKLAGGEDDRLSAKFIHNPNDERPMYLDTELFYHTYFDQLNDKLVLFRQVFTLTKPKTQTPYNLELFDYMCDEFEKTLDYIEEIIKSLN